MSPVPIWTNGQRGVVYNPIVSSLFLLWRFQALAFMHPFLVPTKNEPKNSTILSKWYNVLARTVTTCIEGLPSRHIQGALPPQPFTALQVLHPLSRCQSAQPLAFVFCPVALPGFRFTLHIFSFQAQNVFARTRDCPFLTHFTSVAETWLGKINRTFYFYSTYFQDLHCTLKETCKKVMHPDSKTESQENLCFEASQRFVFWAFCTVMFLVSLCIVLASLLVSQFISGELTFMAPLSVYLFSTHVYTFL